jgi:hypothetical protein
MSYNETRTADLNGLTGACTLVWSHRVRLWWWYLALNYTIETVVTSMLPKALQYQTDTSKLHYKRLTST